MANKKIAGITVEIGGDTTKLGKALQDSDKKARELKTELKEVDKALKLDPSNVVLLKQKQDILAESIKNSKEKLDKLKEAQQQITEQYQRGEIDEGQYRAFQREIENTEAELKNFKTEAEKAGNAGENLGKNVSSVKDDFKKAGDNIDKAGQKVTAFGDSMTKAGEKATAASVVIGAAAAASYKAWEETDSGYDTIVKKTGATGEALEDLQNVANKVFTSMPVDMGKVGTAVGEINTRFGASGDELEKLTTAFLKYSEINDSDVNGSVDNVSAAMQAFGVDSSKAGDVLNKITSISQRTGISVSQLESTLLQQSATFKEMGLSIGESAELLGQFEANGVDTSTAIAALKKAQQNAAAGGKTLSDELQKNVKDIKNAKTDTEALQIATDLFGKKGAAAMAQGIREDRISLEDLNSTLYDTKDTVSTTFEATLDAPDKLKVALNQVKLEASNLAAVAMEKLAPALKTLTDKVKELTQKFNSLSDDQKTLVLKIAGIAAAIGPLLIVIGKLTSGIGGVISSVGRLFSLIATNPSVAVVAGIAAVVAALAILYVKNEEFRNFVNDMAKEFVQFFKDMTNEIKKWYTDNKPVIDQMITVLQFLIKVIGEYLMKTIQDLWQAFKTAWTIISTTWQVATSFFSTIWENIKQIFSVVESVLTGDFSGAWEGIKKIFTNTGEFFGGVWDSIKNVFSGIGTWFSEKFSNAWDYAKKAFGLEKVGKAFGDVKDKIVGAFKSIPEAIEEIFNDALDKAKSIAGKIGDEAEKITDKIPGVSTAKKAAGKIKSKIPFLASGGVLSRNGDVAVVGEAGPELLQLLNGKAVVTPFGGGGSQPKPTMAENTQTAPNRTVVHQTYNIYVKEFASPQDARTTSQELARLQRQTDFGKGMVTV